MKDVPRDKILVNYKWTFKIKRDEFNNIIKYKSRLCAKGFTQREGIDYNETFSPVARHTTFRLIMSLGTVQSFHYEHIDIKVAFLYAELKENIHV